MGVCLQSVGVWGGGGLTQSVLKYATYLNKKVSQLNINLCAFSRSVTWTVRLHHVQVASEGSRLWKTRAWGGGPQYGGKISTNMSHVTALMADRCYLAYGRLDN